MTATPQAASRFYARDPSDDTPLVGGKVYFYIAGTTTPKDTFADADKTAKLTNPVILEADGGADIFLDGTYKVVVRRANDTLVREQDSVVSIGAETSGGGGFGGEEVIYTSDHTITAEDQGKVVIANRPTAIVFSFEGAAELGSDFSCIIKNIGAGDLTLDPNLSETIDGVTTKVIASGAGDVLVTCNGILFRTSFGSSGGGGGGSGVWVGEPQGRVSLLFGTPVVSSNVIGASSIHFSRYGGQLIPIWGGSEFVATEFSDMTVALNSSQHTNNSVYDVGVFNDGGTLRLALGPAWSGLFTRSAAIARVDGIWCNTSSITVTYGGSSSAIVANEFTVLGSVYMTANGQTEYKPVALPASPATKARVCLGNIYNPVPIVLQTQQNTNGGWSGVSTAGTFRAINNNANAALEMMVPIDGVAVDAIHQNSGSFLASGKGGIAIGLDSVSVPAHRIPYRVQSSAVGVSDFTAHYKGNITQGFHALTALEYGQNGTAMTWNGSITSPFTAQLHNFETEIAL